MKSRVVKVIFDTNVWISFLIGKQLSGIRPHISDGRIQIVTTDLLLWEIKEVTGRKKLRKYFAPQSVDELMELLELIKYTFRLQCIRFAEILKTTSYWI